VWGRDAWLADLTTAPFVHHVGPRSLEVASDSYVKVDSCSSAIDVPPQLHAVLMESSMTILNADCSHAAALLCACIRDPSWIQLRLALLVESDRLSSEKAPNFMFYAATLFFK